MKRDELEFLVTVVIMLLIMLVLLLLGACGGEYPPANTTDGIFCMNVNQHEAFLNKTKADAQSYKLCGERGGVPKTGMHADGYGHNFLEYQGCEWPPVAAKLAAEEVK